MAQVIWTEPALSDLDAIADYSALDNFDAARGLVRCVFTHVGRQPAPTQDYPRPAIRLDHLECEVRGDGDEVERRQDLGENQVRGLADDYWEIEMPDGFVIPDSAIHARSENQFLSFDLECSSRHSQAVSSRSSVRVEFVAIAPRRVTTARTVRPLIDEITNRTTAEPVTLECLSIRRRIARHVYDVHRIATVHYVQPNPSLPIDLFHEIVAAEADQYGNRDASFGANPARALRETLLRVAEHSDFRQHYLSARRTSLRPWRKKAQADKVSSLLPLRTVLLETLLRPSMRSMTVV